MKSKFFKKKSDNEYIVGRNAVKEALNGNRIIDSIMVPENSRSLESIIVTAKEKNITIKKVSKSVLDNLIPGNENHQVIAAMIGAKESATVEEILKFAKEKGEEPFIIIADKIEDPHNLGAIIRTAECCGAHGVIIPKRRASGLTLAVEKSSAGALEHMLVAKVTNISHTIDKLKENGVWIYALDMSGDLWTSKDLKGSLGLVVGSEGNGISENVRKKCDFVLSLPMKGKINSLNASVAAGVLMYEVCRQRNF